MIKWEFVWGKKGFQCVEYKMYYIQCALGNTGKELRSEVSALFRGPVCICFQSQNISQNFQLQRVESSLACISRKGTYQKLLGVNFQNLQEAQRARFWVRVSRTSAPATLPAVPPPPLTCLLLDPRSLAGSLAAEECEKASFLTRSMGCQDEGGLGFKVSHKYSTKVILPPFMSMNEKIYNFLSVQNFIVIYCIFSCNTVMKTWCLLLKTKLRFFSH